MAVGRSGLVRARRCGDEPGRIAPREPGPMACCNPRVDIRWPLEANACAPPDGFKQRSVGSLGQPLQPAYRVGKAISLGIDRRILGLLGCRFFAACILWRAGQKSSAVESFLSPRCEATPGKRYVTLAWAFCGRANSVLSRECEDVVLFKSEIRPVKSG